MQEKVEIRGRFKIRQNIKMVLRDKDGKIKPLFTENKLGQKILQFFRKINPNPIDENTNQVKKGILNYLAAYGLRIPFLTGSWGDFRLISNLVVNAGAAGVASRINGSGGEAAFTYIGVGIGATAAAATDTALQTERDEAGAANTNHKSATASRVTTDVTNDTAQLVVTFNFTATLAITESGVFNATPGGTMLARQVFSAYNVINGDGLQMTWKFDVD